MTQNSVVVIDGSNIATEGRSLPSLAQLDEAVRSFLEEYPHDQFIVVVDATFEHRIDPSERQMYDEALAANELLTPPAGTIGRGDAFILAIAEKANATVFSNDSFQEFHGDFDWLFEEGRLIGGKPVPFIGWVFTARTPVRGQKSRQATRSSARKRVRAGETASAKSATRATPRRSATSPAANLPMPVPSVPPPGPVRSRRGEGRVEAPAAEGPDQQRPRPRDEDRGDGADRTVRRGGRKRSAAPSLEPVNDGLAFVTFISEHAVGETVDGVVTEFSSHGAYVTVGEARCYVPLAYLGDPPPRAAREVLERGATHSFVVQAVDGPRRAIDLALPGFERLDGVTDRAEGIDEDDEAPAARRSRLTADDEVAEAPPRRTRAARAPSPAPVEELAAEVAGELADEPVVRRRTRKGLARARAALTNPPDELGAAADPPTVDDEAAELEAAAAPRPRTRRAAPPVAAVEAGAPVDDAEEVAPRRRTRKASTPVAGEPPDPLAPAAGVVAAGAAGADDGSTDRPVRRTRPRKVAEQPVEPAADELVAAGDVAPDPLAPEAGAADAGAADRPVRRGRSRKVAEQPVEPAGAQPVQAGAGGSRSTAGPAAEARSEQAGAAVAAPAEATPGGPPPRGRGRRVAVPDPAAPSVVPADGDDAPATEAPAPPPAKRPARKAAAKKSAATAADAAPPGRAPARAAKAEAVADEAAPAPRPRKARAAADPAAPESAAPEPAKRAPAKRTAKKAAPAGEGEATPPAKATRKRSPRSTATDT